MKTSFKVAQYPVSLLNCTLRSDFKGWKNVVLQIRIFFSLKISGSANSDFFFRSEKSGSANLILFSGCRTTFFATLKITSKCADWMDNQDTSKVHHYKSERNFGQKFQCGVRQHDMGLTTNRHKITCYFIFRTLNEENKRYLRLKSCLTA